MPSDDVLMQRLEHAADEVLFVIATNSLPCCMLHLKELIESSDFPELSILSQACMQPRLGALRCLSSSLAAHRYEVFAFLQIGLTL